MSREIKFRAWIKNKNRMENCIEVNSFYVGDCDRFRWKHDEVELMQYIGIKDKNDKEIYDGDIVKVTYSSGFSIYVVKYANDCAYYMLESIMDKYELDTFCGYEQEQLEVIGNKFENYKLIEELRISILGRFNTWTSS
jgi:uncharacterized phage protein (TIGR01671 family)